MSIGAVILAAGEGSRIGFRPKCLLCIGGEPLIQRQIRFLKGAGVSDIVVVLGHYGAVIQQTLGGLPVNFCWQAQDTHKQTDSVRLGVSALPEGVEAVMVSPSDLPLLEEADYRELIKAFAARREGVHFLGPLVDGVPGNPVIFDAHARSALVSGHGPFGNGQWRRGELASGSHWKTGNRHYVTDVDTEADRARISGEFGIDLVWSEH